MRLSAPARWIGVLAAASAFTFGAAACSNDNSDSSATTSAAATSVAPVPAGSLRIDGAVARPKVLTLDDLRKLPARTESVKFGSSKGDQEHTFVGAPLGEVLAGAQPVTDASAKNPSLRLAVLATGADGYQAVVSWGEFDAEFGGTPVLVAYTEDGRDLERPRLVVPGDIKGGRYVSDLTTLTVIDAGAR